MPELWQRDERALLIGDRAHCLKTRRRELIDVQLRDQRDDWPRHVFGPMFAASRESNDSSGFSTLNPTAMSLTSR
jgi:hypothetical protein